MMRSSSSVPPGSRSSRGTPPIRASCGPRTCREAKLLIVAIPDAFEAGQIVEQARAVNPRIEIVARAHFDAEVEHLLQHGANTVVMGEREIARTMLELARTSPAVETT